jgi:hypothetical protein
MYTVCAYTLLSIWCTIKELDHSLSMVLVSGTEFHTFAILSAKNHQLYDSSKLNLNLYGIAFLKFDISKYTKNDNPLPFWHPFWWHALVQK